MSDCVVLCDGSLAGLVALAIEAERADSAPVVFAGDPLGSISGADIEAASVAVRAQAAVFNATVIEGAFLMGGVKGAEQSRSLLAAAHVASAAGRRRLVWGVQFPFAGSEPDLDLVAATVDRCLLVSRLASLDLWGDASASIPEVRIETPLVDLADEQLADLATDLRVPWQTVWWLKATGARAGAERSRWTSICEDLGLASSAA